MSKVNQSTGEVFLDMEAVRTIDPNQSTIIVPNVAEKTELLVRQATHYIADRAVNLSNGNIINASTVKKNGVKTFSHDSLSHDFQIRKFRLRYDENCKTDPELLTVNFATATLPDSIKHTRITLIQGFELFVLTADELFNGNSDLQNKDWYSMIAPIKLRKDIPFQIMFENTSAYGGGEAFRIEFGGLEYVQVAANVGKSCGFSF